MRVISSSSGGGGSRSWDTGAYWTTNISKNDCSSCVLELKREELRRRSTGTITVLVTPAGPQGCPIKCLISTSENQAFGFRTVESNWRLRCPVANDPTTLKPQSYSFRDSQCGRFLTLYFYGTHDGSRLHRISRLAVTITREGRRSRSNSPTRPRGKRNSPTSTSSPRNGMYSPPLRNSVSPDKRTHSPKLFPAQSGGSPSPSPPVSLLVVLSELNGGGDCLQCSLPLRSLILRWCNM